MGHRGVAEGPALDSVGGSRVGDFPGVEFRSRADAAAFPVLAVMGRYNPVQGGDEAFTNCLATTRRH